MNLIATAVLGIADLTPSAAPLSSFSECTDFSGQYRLSSCVGSGGDMSQATLGIAQAGCESVNYGMAATFGTGEKALTLYSARTFLAGGKHTEIDESEAASPDHYSQLVTRAPRARADVITTVTSVSGWYLDGASRQDYEFTANNRITLRHGQLLIESTLVSPSEGAVSGTCTFDRQ